MTTGEILADQIAKTRDWTLKLLADLRGSDWIFQPAPGLQHALWIGGHLACAQELLLFQRCLGRSVLDPAFTSHFPIGADIRSADEYAWPDPGSVRGHMDDMQERTLRSVCGLSDDLLAEPAFGEGGTRHPHYDTKLGAIAHLVRHEAFHAGQLALIRRLLGRPFIR